MTRKRSTAMHPAMPPGTTQPDAVKPDLRKLESLVLGEMVIDSALSCGMVVSAYSAPAFENWRKVSPHNVGDALEVAIEAVREGDLSSLEAALVSQVFAMQAMFTDLANRARAQTSREGISSLTALAIKAQSASRATVQAIAELKSPRQVAFIRQQTNVTTAGGQQQVNNATGTTSSLARAPAREDSAKAQNEQLLLEAHARPIMDSRAARGARQSGKELDPVEAQHRTKNSGRPRRVGP
jgi:hypothetical protein